MQLNQVIQPGLVMGDFIPLTVNNEKGRDRRKNSKQKYSSTHNFFILCVLLTSFTLVTSYFSLFLKLAKLILAPKTLYMFSALYQVHVFYLLVIFQVSTDYHFIITSLTNGQYSYMILSSYFIANIMMAFK